MKETAQYFFAGFFAVLALGIVFVQAGKSGGLNGGAQTANIISSAGGSLSSVAKSLETGT